MDRATIVLAPTLVLALLAPITTGCGRQAEVNQTKAPPAEPAAPSPPSPAPAPAAQPQAPEQNATQAPVPALVANPGAAGGILTEITEQVGLAPPAAPWPDGVYLTPEITPGGVGLIDFDQDGDLDIYQVRHCEPAEMPASFKGAAPNRLFRQEADGRFVEVEDAAGLKDPGYGHGCAMGDFDNDGDVDVLVTNYGPNRLYLNEGGRFRDVTESAGITGEDWSSAAAFFDYDRDGLLDLFVVNFGVFDPTKRCGQAGSDGGQDYCGPHLFEGVNDKLYHNNGDGTFTDVTDTLGVTTPGRGWGVICADLTDDGWPDIYVCNDEEPNQLWINSGDPENPGFFDEAMLVGVAVNGFGRVEASMGVTVGDVNGDGRFDLFMTHVASESNTLYTGEGGELFADATPQTGMAAVDLPYTGWGCGLVDLDHDGDLDLTIANGRVAVGTVLPNARLGDYWNRYAEPNLVFLNDGRGAFTNTSDRAGSFAAEPGLTRGLAFGDIDNDGDVDMVTSSIDNRLKVYRNDAPPEGANWLQLRLLAGPRDALGARVRLETPSGPRVRYLLRSYSYLASNDPRVHFGLGEDDRVDGLTVLWPDGKEESFRVDGVNRVVTLKQGTGDGS